jgi:DNA-binding XRE family transcriptional regulator
MTLTPEAMRAGRAILKWTMRDLADRAGVSLVTVNAAENGRPCRESTAATLAATFASHGVETFGGARPGARLIPLDRADIHDGVERIVDALAVGAPPPADAVRVLASVTSNRRASADLLPRSLGVMLRDLADEDGSRPPSTYSQAAALLRRALAP